MSKKMNQADMDRAFENAVALRDLDKVKKMYGQYREPHSFPPRALAVATRYGGREMVQLLLSHGASFRAPVDPDPEVAAAHRHRELNGQKIPQTEYDEYVLPKLHVPEDDYFMDELGARMYPGIFSITELLEAGEDMQYILYAAFLDDWLSAPFILKHTGPLPLPEEGAALVSGTAGAGTKDRKALSRAFGEAAEVDSLGQLLGALLECTNVDRIAFCPEDLWGDDIADGIGTAFCAPDIFPVVLEHSNILDVADPYMVLRGLAEHGNVDGLREMLNRDVLCDEDELTEILEHARALKNAAVSSLLLSKIQALPKTGQALSLDEEAGADKANKQWDFRTLADGTLELTGYRGRSIDVIVPERIDGKTVSTVCTTAFRTDAPGLDAQKRAMRNKIRSVELPDTITAITDESEGLFKNMEALRHVRFSESMPRIPDWTCWGCTRLESVHIPDCVREIGSCAFEGCGIREIDIPESVEKIGLGALSDCENLQRVRWRGKAEPEADMFSESRNLRDVELPAGTEVIPDGCFRGAGIRDLSFLPSGVEMIWEGAFRESALERVELPAQVQYVSENAFRGCPRLQTVQITGPVYMMENLFRDCKALTDVRLQDIFSIPAGAFRGCTALEEIHLGPHIYHIEERAFQGTGLRRVVLPDTVLSIGRKAFADCRNLEEVEFRRCPHLSPGIFSGCQALRTVTFPKMRARTADRTLRRLRLPD